MDALKKDTDVRFFAVIDSDQGLARIQVRSEPGEPERSIIQKVKTSLLGMGKLGQLTAIVRVESNVIWKP